MTEYTGRNALDAEIQLDLVKGDIIIDYSLNKFGSNMDSNMSYSDDTDTFAKLPVLARGYCWVKFIGIMSIGMIGIAFTSITSQLVSKDGWFRDLPQKHQKFMAWFHKQTLGIRIHTVSGKLPEPKIVIQIPNNVWIHYELTGDYEKKIKSVSLKRNLVSYLEFGKFPKTAQRGWKVIFEFTDIPEDGSCTLQRT
jgi:hypothetical protein